MLLACVILSALARLVARINQAFRARVFENSLLANPFGKTIAIAGIMQCMKRI
jgi:hypothetical protein